MKNILFFIITCLIHKFWVFFYLFVFCLKLMLRALLHDISKFSLIELKGFSKSIAALSGLTYGSKEYKKSMEQLNTILKHHYASNRHHPEYFKEYGIDNMNLIDVVEMFFDWKASIKKHKNGDINQSLAVNTKRFNISSQLFYILENSIKEI